MYTINLVYFVPEDLCMCKNVKMLLKCDRVHFLLICITRRMRPNKSHVRTARIGGDTTISNLILTGCFSPQRKKRFCFYVLGKKSNRLTNSCKPMFYYRITKVHATHQNRLLLSPDYSQFLDYCDHVNGSLPCKQLCLK